MLLKVRANGNLIYAEGISLRENVYRQDRSRPDVWKTLVGAKSEVEL